jgi:type I restriction enzyme S subunit
VPEEWDVLALGELGTWGGGSTPRKSNTEYWGGTMPWVSPKDMGEPVVKRTEDHVTRQALSQTNLTVYRPGSVVVVFRSGVLRHTFPVATLDQPFTVNQDMKVLSTWDAVDDRFVFHLLRCMGPLVLQRATKVGTTVESVDTTSFKSLPVGLPPLPEQRRIADVLDTVDAAIRETDNVIAKQEQVKTGLLQDLLTRGLDAEGRLRDPEVNPEAFRETELGLLPVEWKVAEMGEVLNEIQAGKSPSCPDIPAASGEWGVVKVSAIKPTGFESSQNKVIVDKAHVHPEYEIKGGDLITSRANTAELVGIMCLVREPQPQLLLSDKSLRLVVDEVQALPEFVFQVSQTPEYRRQVEIAGTGSSGSMKNISQKNIRHFTIPLPPVPEQNRIVNRLSSTSNRRDKEKEYRTKLQRLKTGLMQDLLTGRVRVPDAEERINDVIE